MQPHDDELDEEMAPSTPPKLSEVTRAHFFACAKSARETNASPRRALVACGIFDLGWVVPRFVSLVAFRGVSAP